MDMKRKQMAAMKMVEVMDEIAGARIQDLQGKKPADDETPAHESSESPDMEMSEDACGPDSGKPEAGLAIMIGKEKEPLDPELAKKKKLMFGK